MTGPPTPTQYGGPPSPSHPQYLSPDYRNSDSYAEVQSHQNSEDTGEHSSEVWQDIVRQLAVS